MRLGMGLRDDTVGLLPFQVPFLETWSVALAIAYFDACPWAYRCTTDTSLAGIAASSAALVAAGTDHEGYAYNLETKSSPPAEWGDPVAATIAAEAIAHAAAKELVMVPGTGLMLDNMALYPLMSAHADLWVLQCQKFMKNPPGQDFREAVMEHVNLIRSGHADIPVWLQISVTPGQFQLGPDEWYEYARSVGDAAGHFPYDGNDVDKPATLALILAGQEVPLPAPAKPCKGLDSGHSRVWLVEGLQRPRYMATMAAGALSKPCGEPVPILAPHPERYEEWAELDVALAGNGPAKLSLEGLYAHDLASDLLRLASAGCPADVQVHLGDCHAPTDYDGWAKIVALDDAELTDWSGDPLGTLDGGAPVRERATVAAPGVYEVTRLGLAHQYTLQSDVTDVLVDGEAMYAVTREGYLLSSLDGVRWMCLPFVWSPPGQASLAKFAGDLHIVTPTLYRMEDRFSAVAEASAFLDTPTCCCEAGGRLLIAGDDGYIYAYDGALKMVAEATPLSFRAVCWRADEALAVGDAGTLFWSANLADWAAVTSPTAGDLVSCTIRVPGEWWVGTATALYRSRDGGVHWDTAFEEDAVFEVEFPTKSVGFIAANHGTQTRLYRSTDGGKSWGYQANPTYFSTCRLSAGVNRVLLGGNL